MPTLPANLHALNCRLELLCAAKDAEIAQLKSQIIVEQLRRAEGASEQATFNPQTFAFTEPETAATDADLPAAPLQ